MKKIDFYAVRYPNISARQDCLSDADFQAIHDRGVGDLRGGLRRIGVDVFILSLAFSVAKGEIQKGSDAYTEGVDQVLTAADEEIRYYQEHAQIIDSPAYQAWLAQQNENARVSMPAGRFTADLQTPGRPPEPPTDEVLYEAVKQALWRAVRARGYRDF